MRGLRRKKVSKGARMRTPLPPEEAVEEPARAVRPRRWMYCSGLAGSPTWRTVVTLAVKEGTVRNAEREEKKKKERTEIHSTSSHVTREHDTSRSVFECLGRSVPLTLTLPRVDLVKVDALLPEAADALKQVGDEAGRPRGGKEDHDLERRTVLCELGAEGGKGEGVEVVERVGGEDELLDVLMRVLLALVDAANELVRREEGEVRDLVNRGRDGSGEKERLTGILLAIGEVSDDLFDFATESGLEETIRLVEDEGLETGELGAESRVLEVVEETTGSGDEDICKMSTLSAFELRSTPMLVEIISEPLDAKGNPTGPE